MGNPEQARWRYLSQSQGTIWFIFATHQADKTIMTMETGNLDILRKFHNFSKILFVRYFL